MDDSRRRPHANDKISLFYGIGISQRDYVNLLPGFSIHQGRVHTDHSHPHHLVSLEYGPRSLSAVKKHHMDGVCLLRSLSSCKDYIGAACPGNHGAGIVAAHLNGISKEIGLLLTRIDGDNSLVRLLLHLSDALVHGC